MDFTISCFCGCPGGTAMFQAVGGQLEAWRKCVNNVTNITCPDCGCQHNLGDGVTHITTVDVSKPKIESINVNTGPAVGGTVVTITGHSLEVGDLVVKFGGIEGINLRNRTDSTAIVDTPAGTGVVDVSVENQFGQRDVGGKIVNGFTYT